MSGQDAFSISLGMEIVFFIIIIIIIIIIIFYG